MNPNKTPKSANAARSGNLSGRPSKSSPVDESDAKVKAAVAVATTKPPKCVVRSTRGRGAKRTQTAAVPPRKPSSKFHLGKKARFPIPKSIPKSIYRTADEEEEEEALQMESSSSSEEYDQSQEDDELDVMWPSVVQAGARLSEARTWTIARPNAYHRKRPRDDDGMSSSSYAPLIQHYDPPRSTALAALKERMRTFVTEALLPAHHGGEEESQLQNSLSAHSGNSSSTLEFTEGCHRRLVEAIFEIGMSHASPAVIMEHMVFPTADWMDDSAHRMESMVEQVTSERVKSHLQKYRKNKNKSKEEFLREYDRWTQKALTVVGGISAAARTNLVISPAAVFHMMGGSSGSAEDASASKASSAEVTHRLLGGDLPAFLTFSVMLEEEHNKILREEGGIPTAATMQRRSSASTDESFARVADSGAAIATQQMVSLPSAREYAQSMSGARVLLPILSEEERQSSLGISISHVVGLFYSMSHALMKQRKKEQLKVKSPPPPPPPPAENMAAPPRLELRSAEGMAPAESDSHAAGDKTAVSKPPPATLEHPHANPPRDGGDYYAASATPTTTSTATTTTAGDPDPERRSRNHTVEDDRYATDASYAYSHHHHHHPHHHHGYESGHYHGVPPMPPYPPPRYPPPPYANNPPYSHPPPPPRDGPPPYNDNRGGQYGL